MKFGLRVAVALFACAFVLPSAADAEVLFTPSSSSPLTGTGPGGQIKSADFNGDGLGDLAIGSVQAETAAVHIRIANADGSWTAKNSIKSPLRDGFPVGEIATGDFDNDGVQDLLVQFSIMPVAVGGSAILQVFLGTGDGSFIEGQVVSFSEDDTYAMLPTGQAIWIADINDDGNDDLMVALLGGMVGFAEGKGDGTFTSLGVTSDFPGAPTGEDEGFGTIASGDFNGDSKTDYVFGLVGKFSGSSTASNSGFFVMYGGEDESGGEMIHVDMTAPYGPALRLIPLDANGDGYDDLILHAAGTSDGSRRALLYQGGPTGFQGNPLTAVTASAATPGLASADFSGDGKLDLAWVEQPTTSGSPKTNSLKLATGSGTGTWALQEGLFDINFAGSQGLASSITNGDFNGDGVADLAAAFGSSDCGAQACGTQVLINRPVLSANQSSFDFGTVEAGSPISLPFTITNRGAAPAKASQPVITGNSPVRFSLTGTCSSIAPGASCSPQINFDRSTAGSWNGDIELRFDGVAEPIHLTASGIVSKPEVPLTYKAALKLTGPKKFTPGKTFKVSATVINSGTGSLNGLTLKWKASQGKAIKAQGSVRLPTIVAGKKLVKAVGIATKKSKIARRKPLTITISAVRQNKTLATKTISVSQSRR